MTYAKKDSIGYDQASHEKYAIVIVEKDHVNIIPFDWFNASHSEYDYSWPATARLNIVAAKIAWTGNTDAGFLH